MASTRKTGAKAAPAVKSKARSGKKSTVPAKTTARRPVPAPTATEFRLFAPEAKEVLLTGDFCAWQGDECRMRRFKDGSWKKNLKLQPGRYEYRFVVDGHWWTDPENPQRQQNPFGQDNSVLIIP